jgi:hypothetical protein
MIDQSKQGSRKEAQQLWGFYATVGGLIPGLRLPLNAWIALKRASIITLPHLRAVADRLESFDGIGVRTAKIIRKELARVASSEDHAPLPDSSQELTRPAPRDSHTDNSKAVIWNANRKIDQARKSASPKRAL